MRLAIHKETYTSLSTSKSPIPHDDISKLCSKTKNQFSLAMHPSDPAKLLFDFVQLGLSVILSDSNLTSNGTLGVLGAKVLKHDIETFVK
jgi:hypothetical protein